MPRPAARGPDSPWSLPLSFRSYSSSLRRWRLGRSRRPRQRSNGPATCASQALAARGNRKARRIAASVEQPGRYLGALTAGRVLGSTLIIAVFAYLGAREYDPFAGTVGYGLIGGLLVAIVQMTVGLVVARSPEYAALRLSAGRRGHECGLRHSGVRSSGCLRGCSRGRSGWWRRTSTRTSSPWSNAKRRPAASKSRNGG